MIEVCELKKVYDRFTAVDRVSFVVQKGEVLGLLGPNGAGKSTLMKMLTCFIPPTSGKAFVGGHSILKDPILVREQIGYMPETSPLYMEMLVSEFLDFMGEMRGLKKAALKQSVERVLNLCDLKEVYYQTIETLSKGYKKRVLLAQGLIHDPPILLLDEPTDGLDPNQKVEVRKLIMRLGLEKTIILSTHILEELEAVCTRAMIMNRGTILYDGMPVELKRKSYEGRLDLVFRSYTTGESIQGVNL